MDIPEGLLDLLYRPSPCYLATTWVDTDGKHIHVNSVQGFQKIKNIERDPRVALNVSDPDNISR